jgi:trehalose/maltose transport system substrate-binding protein
MRMLGRCFCCAALLLGVSGIRLDLTRDHSLSGGRWTTSTGNQRAESSNITHALRNDLRGSSISIELPENEPDRAWNDDLMRTFEQRTGIHVTILRPGNDTTLVLKDYLNQFRNGSPQGDVYAIDIVWSGLLAEYAEDLRPALGDLREFVPALARNDIVNGKLVALPYFVEVSLLYYRTDLLQKYGFTQPPRTWKELEDHAGTIQARERKAGNRNFWGYLWQGAASEALTCNALEWQASEGGGSLLAANGTIDFDRTVATASWNRARNWIGTISPANVANQLEDDSLKTWKNGDAAFMRNWPYAYQESMKPDSKVNNKVAVTVFA